MDVAVPPGVVTATSDRSRRVRGRRRRDPGRRIHRVRRGRRAAKRHRRGAGEVRPRDRHGRPAQGRARGRIDGRHRRRGQGRRDRERRPGDREEDVPDARDLHAGRRAGGLRVREGNGLRAVVRGRGEERRRERGAAVGGEGDRDVRAGDRSEVRARDVPGDGLRRGRGPGHGGRGDGDREGPGRRHGGDRRRVGVHAAATAPVVARRQAEVHRPARRRHRLAVGRRSGEDVGEFREGPGRADGRVERAEDGAVAGVDERRRRFNGAEVELFPSERQGIALGVARRSREGKRRSGGDRVRRARVDRRCRVRRRRARRAARAAARRDVGDDLVEALAVEVRVAVGLEVLRAADTRVRHDRRPASRLVGGRCVPVPAGAGAEAAVERVVPAELVPHLVRDVVDPERVSGRGRPAGHAARLRAGAADDPQARDPPAAGREDVPDVVVRAPDHGVQVALVLSEHRAAAAVRVGVGRAVEVDDGVVARYERHPHGDLALVDSVHPVHGDDELGRDARLRGAGAADCDGVLAGRRECEPVGPERRADGDERERSRSEVLPLRAEGGPSPASGVSGPWHSNGLWGSRRASRRWNEAT